MDNYSIKTIGFIKEDEARILDNVINYENGGSVKIITDELALDKIIKYLESGISIFTMTLALMDNEGKVIGPYEILTDGNWLWPRYYPYYLKSKKVNTIGQDFYDQMKLTFFTIQRLSSEKYEEAKKCFWEILFSNNKVKNLKM